MICDYCSDPNPKYRFPCKSFILRFPISGYIHESVDDWAACSTCALMIAVNDREALFCRSVTTFKEKHGVEMPLSL